MPSPSEARPHDDFLDLTILKANWGNALSRKQVDEAIKSMPRNALMFHVNHDAFKRYLPNLPDPAHGDDNKYVEVEYSYSGSGPLTVRRKQGEWICLPEDPVMRAEIKRLTATPSKPRQSLGRLKLKYADVGSHRIAESGSYEVLWIQNTQSSVPFTAKYVSARVRFIPIGAEQPKTIPQAVWNHVHTDKETGVVISAKLLMG